MTDIDNIQQLLDRFMEGLTTEQEERLLTDYFNSVADVPEEWNAYAVLFRGFKAETKPQGEHRRLWLYPAMGTVAASIFLLLTFYSINKSEQKDVQTMVAQQTKKQIDIEKSEEKIGEVVTIEKTPVMIETEHKRPIRSTHSRKPTTQFEQKSKETEYVVKLLDEADMAFSQATRQCTRDIDEIILQDEDQEETENETNIII